HAGHEVILPGFTCSVMVNAVLRVGAQPVFTNINKDCFGSDANEIEKKISKQTKLIVAQHSFGIPCDIENISNLAKKRGIFLVEDCAITLDSSYEGIKVGNWGDAAIFSTDHSKPINTIIGGFLFTRDKDLFNKIQSINQKIPHLSKEHQYRLFSRMLFEKKYCNPANYPRVMILEYLQMVKKSFYSDSIFLENDYCNPLISNPGDYPYPAKMPPFLAKLGLFEIERWESERKRRKNLLEGYLQIAKQLGFDTCLPKAYFADNIDIVPLRFVFRCEQYDDIIRNMSRYVDTNWIWFREPIICCPDGVESLGYKNGSCSLSETIGQTIVNWPCAIPHKWHSTILKDFNNTMNSYKIL
ncbi:MAG: aminotransferase, partial [Clostridiaceae bacterium]|nr:aminotransferase [Clostridiaceae bacterium]